MTGWGHSATEKRHHAEKQRAARQLLALQTTLNETRGKLAGAERRLAATAAERDQARQALQEALSFLTDWAQPHYSEAVSVLKHAALTGPVGVPAEQPEQRNHAINDVQVGDRVEAVLKGKLIAYDPDSGRWTLETDGTDHVSWRIELHWSQPFRPVAEPLVAVRDNIDPHRSEV